MEKKINKDKKINQTNKYKKIPKKVDKDKDKNLNNDINQYNIEFLNYSKDYKYDLNFKIIIIGNSGVGKTCIANQAIKNEFSENYINTIGLEICSLFLKLNNITIKFQIWDTCGQEIYRSLIKSFYRNSSLAIIVYSINNINSFDDIDLWIKELKINSSPDIKLILVGNKSDLEERREVQYEEGEKLAKDYGFVHFIETSAKTGENIKNLFIKAASVLYTKHIQYKEAESVSSHSTFHTAFGENFEINKLKRKKSKCC